MVKIPGLVWKSNWKPNYSMSLSFYNLLIKYYWMSSSDEELERKLEELLPKALHKLGYIYTPDQLATKEDIENLRQQMDERFLKVFERMEKHDEEIKSIREEMKQQNEEIKSIREEMKQQNEEIKGIQEEIKSIREEMKLQNEEIKSIREEMKLQNDRIDKLIIAMNNGFSLIHADLAKISSKYGRMREEEARKLLDEVLKHFGVPSYKVRKVQVIDKEGIVFAKGYITDVDLYLEKDEEVWAFEFKANCDRFDLFGFHKICELLEKGYGKKVSRKILACFDASDEVKVDAETFGIEIWQPKTEIPGLVLPNDL
ncbi:MAG: hypothetical protein D6732_02370 [Methanobacteriota archaeon]|nr:MAG: hypothetical protein D6732_02370 [Euryarchaeota archaeon]